MSAPYWGQLPPPNARRMSGDSGQPDRPDRRQSLDQPPAQFQSRSNRASVQTTHTESTFSPLESPATSYFPNTGLAPRPSSLSYGHNRYPSDLQEKRRRRTSQTTEDIPEVGSHDEGALSPPPAAPDVPRAPPVSYKDPYRHSSPAFTPTYSYNADGQPGPPLSAYRFGSPRYGSPAQARIAGMEPESFYKDATPPAEKQNRAPTLDRARQTFGENEGIDKLDRDNGSMGRPTNGDLEGQGIVDPYAPKRQPTLAGPPRRPTFADDRSPLQRLELTLDSITKEEKRARVEAAERRARERAVRRENAVNEDKLQPPPERSSSQQVKVRDRRQSASQYDDPMQVQPSAVTFHGPLSQNPPEETKQYTPPGQSPSSKIPVPKNRNIAAPQKTDLPQRNLSFRERAAKNDGDISADADSNSQVSPISSPGGGFALARNGSNKLKKNPPSDPWYGQRKEAEEKSMAQRRNLQSDGTYEMPRDINTAPIVARPRNEPITRDPTSQYVGRPPARGKQFEQEDYEEPRQRGVAATSGPGRNDSVASSQRSPPSQQTFQSSLRNSDAPPRSAGKSVTFPDRRYEAQEFDDDDYDSDLSEHKLGIHDYMHRRKLKPGRGMYQPPKYLEEWKKSTVGTLAGSLLDLNVEPPNPNPGADKGTPWWENSGRRRSSTTTRPPPELFSETYDDTQGPTRFKPPLYLKCGPLLRYCGMRHEKPLPRGGDASMNRDIWRGTVMIVTQDTESSYDIPPILRLFVQPIELLPPPPAELRGEQVLPPEYVDPIAGIPKLGRRGETLFVRPVEHLEEAKDVSRLDPDDGLFEITRSAPDFNNAPDPPGSFACRKRRTPVDGEKLGKYKDVRGFRLHAERGHTFWRFNIEVELREKQQRIAYRINHGPATGFWVPARDQSMNIMFHSCNGFSLSVNPDDFSGPDPMWRDVLNNHQTRPFHVMIGGGDQLYNDAIMRETRHFQDWLQIKNPLHKNNAPLTPEMQDEMENFYLERYMMWFSQGLFGLANCQIPMVNMYDDHDIIDGYGSYPDHFMKSPVFSGLGNVAFKYYMLFQHQSLPDETEETEPSWVTGIKPGPYIREQSRSLFMFLGNKVALLAVDCRTERTRDEVVTEDTWKKLMDRCDAELVKGETQHLLVLLGVPIAYPRLVWLENILTSRLMDPIKALGKAGMLGNFLNRFDGGVEVLDDLDDHWTAKNHKDERRFVIEDLQDLAVDASVRVTILSGDVHLAAVGQFYSNPKLNLPKHKDFRYMPNIISSAIANTPPPDLMADILNKRNKVHHFDKETDEDMIPLFTNDVDGKPRNNKHLLPHRNWCSIREYVPGQTPPPTPPPEEFDETPEATPPNSRGGLLRRFSLSSRKGSQARPNTSHAPVDRSRPPVSGGGGLFRSLSRRASDAGTRPNKLLRTLSLGRGDSARRGSTSAGNGGGSGGGGLFRRRSTERADDGGINGAWGPDSEDDEDAVYETQPQRYARPNTNQTPMMAGAAGREYREYNGARDGGASMGHLRGGAGDSRHVNDEYEVGDEAFFSARPPRRAVTQPVAVATTSSSYSAAAPTPARRNTNGGPSSSGNAYDNYYDPNSSEEDPMAAAAPRRPFHRTPTGLSAKKLQKRGAARYEVDLQGGLDVCLNVEVNPKDPAGITVPYRLLVPRLWYEYEGEDASPSPPVAEVQKPLPPSHPQPARAQERAPVRDREDEDYDDEEEDDYEGEYDGEYEYEEKPGMLKRLFSKRGRNAGGSGGGGGGSQYRARRMSP
ncbi:uncharacterized protein F4807DRAFT_453987 [Annulohypoxylon truncatum]|uniref:uncharacterized protein n=1 Tax=Annulohypoxylon truncatum TaxID=327061 RepID=UPI0020089608|nr:uncharacterized protein F4807DRAFT_453987 [Annulohypoxylon truncatum]KAI1205378.1 hypothetical protein F4807DRAFT_453987 [Annulohypoxylon truncatum]